MTSSWFFLSTLNEAVRQCKGSDNIRALLRKVNKDREGSDPIYLELTYQPGIRHETL